MAKPIDLNKLNAKIDLVLTLLGDVDLDVFELKIAIQKLQKKNGPGGLTPHRGLIAEHVAN